MGKTMDKSTVIYGGDRTIALNAVNWDLIKKAIIDEIGDEPIATPMAGAKKTIEEAKKDKSLDKAYVKVGVVDGTLVLRIKDVRTLIDKEIDAILVKQFKQKKQAYEKIMAAAGKGGGNGVVVSLDPKDKVIKPAADSISKDRKLGADGPLQRAGQDYADKDKKQGAVVDDKNLKGKPFAASNNAPIVILAHGAPIGKVGSGKVHATEFGGKSSSAIVDYLKKSLPVTYSGVVYLDGCYTAAGNTPLNFGKQVYDGMVKAGYFYMQIKGNLGMARTVDGKEFVTPAEIEKAYENARKEKKTIEPQIPPLKKKYEDIRAGITNDMKSLALEARKAGRMANNYNDDEKRRNEALLARITENNSNMENDPKIKKLSERLKALNVVLADPKYNIEALTATWGPEKLPPRV